MYIYIMQLVYDCCREGAVPTLESFFFRFAQGLVVHTRRVWEFRAFGFSYAAGAVETGRMHGLVCL